MRLPLSVLSPVQYSALDLLRLFEPHDLTDGEGGSLLKLFSVHLVV